MLNRIAQYVQRGGRGGLLRKLGLLLVRRRSYVLFEKDCSGVSFPAPSAGERIQVLTAANIDGAADVAERLVELNAESADYLQDIRCGRVTGIVFIHGGQVVQYSYVFKKNKTACLLGLPPTTALIGNDFTVPSYRGRGCQGRSVEVRACVAREAGFTAVVAETSPDNIASQRGLQKGGMRPLGKLDMLVLLNCLVIRWRRPAGFPLLGLCL